MSVNWKTRLAPEVLSTDVEFDFNSVKVKGIAVDPDTRYIIEAAESWGWSDPDRFEQKAQINEIFTEMFGEGAFVVVPHGGMPRVVALPTPPRDGVLPDKDFFSVLPDKDLFSGDPDVALKIRLFERRIKEALSLLGHKGGPGSTADALSTVLAEVIVTMYG